MSWLDGWKLKPETAEDVKDVETVEGMRKRLQTMARHDPLVRNVMDAAYYRGLSGEDTMTMLAYHALLDRDRFRDMVLEGAMIAPAPIYILNPTEVKNVG